MHTNDRIKVSLILDPKRSLLKYADRILHNSDVHEIFTLHRSRTLSTNSIHLTYPEETLSIIASFAEHVKSMETNGEASYIKVEVKPRETIVKDILTFCENSGLSPEKEGSVIILQSRISTENIQAVYDLFRVFA